jgi:YegS/Rv2252/BmrU family lipid kinase
MRRLLFVINPISGGRDKHEEVAAIKAGCAVRNWSYRILETTGEQDDRRIAAAIEAFGPDTVVAGGGDGTVNLVARVVLDHPDCRLGILPLGSANGLATELGITGNVNAALEVLRTGRLIAMDALRIQQDHYCFHLADIGYNAELVARFERAGLRGKLGYARESLRTILRRPVARFELTLDGHSFRQRAVMITFANGQRYGTGAVVNPAGHIDDGCFEVCIFQPWPRWYLLWIVLLAFLGRVDRSRWVKVLPARRAEVVVEPPLALQADGEPLGKPRRISVVLAPTKVSLWVPNSS